MVSPSLDSVTGGRAEMKPCFDSSETCDAFSKGFDAL